MQAPTNQYRTPRTTRTPRTRRTPRHRRSPKHYIPNMSAAKKWDDNGTTGFKETEKDLNKQCDEWKVKTSKAKERRDRAHAKLIKLCKARKEARKVIAESNRMEPDLVDKLNAAHDNWRNTVEGEALFLFNMLNENRGDEEEDSDDEDDETVSMSSRDDNHDDRDLPTFTDWPTGVTGSPDY